MLIDASNANANAAAGFTPGSKTEIDRQLQAVFTHAPEAAGRVGWASAEPASVDPAVSADIKQAWGAWIDSERDGRYASRDADALEQAFGDVLVRAHNEGGYVDPHGFLLGLSSGELETIRQVHSLADAINPATLSEEGALNLLLPPAAQVDLNRDGITQSGLANGIRFPNSDTPAEVVAAWEAATAGMSWGDRAMYELQMMLPLLTANIEIDQNGVYVRTYEPGDPEYVNPMARDDYSYRDAVQAMLDALEFQKDQLPAKQYLERTDFWRHFADELEGRNAA